MGGWPSMLYKTYESDEDGRLIIYPSLDPPKGRAVFTLIRKLLKLVSAEGIKGMTGERGEQQ